MGLEYVPTMCELPATYLRQVNSRQRVLSRTVRLCQARANNSQGFTILCCWLSVLLLFSYYAHLQGSVVVVAAAVALCTVGSGQEHSELIARCRAHIWRK